MALTAVVDLTKSPVELHVHSDRRKVTVAVHAAGEDVTATGLFPLVTTDPDRTWTVKSDDGVDAVLTA